MILGISASGRKDGITSKTVKAILESSNSEYEYISLSGKRINGCIGCTLCAADNKCKVKDDWNEIAEKMLMADAIVFGAPNYGGTINALGHACLERTFCFRHRAAFSLSGKLGVAVSASYSEQGASLVNMIIKKSMMVNKMSVVGAVSAHGYSQCYTCGFGHKCNAGNVVKKYGILDKIEKKHLPPSFEEQEDTILKANSMGKLLESLVSK
ncbi:MULTISPECIES: flavodoxin family protein [Clostridium]|uniref:Iron-sulfur flavoprotein n=2 Tax=Clostridium TaxID=1485 RepID=A0A1A6AVW7_9CLOT|nr:MULTISPECIES: flavodoxin family protein [Clostridium]OBR94231.1 iron-sulfur flavoprotein [Clostridium ragsdalei P11]QXE18257.1 NADPH-dependent FMN reductase [Clostridium sp. 001]RMC98604.1 flavodoxin family protein [Clostridium autoethanogenum]